MIDHLVKLELDRIASVIQVRPRLKIMHRARPFNRHGFYSTAENQVTINIWPGVDIYHIQEVLAHEMAHALAWKECPKSDAHGLAWKTRYIRILRDVYSLDLPIQNVNMYINKTVMGQLMLAPASEWNL